MNGLSLAEIAEVLGHKLVAAVQHQLLDDELLEGIFCLGCHPLFPEPIAPRIKCPSNTLHLVIPRVTD